MKRRLAFAAMLVVVFVAGAHTLLAASKLPKCASVNCRALGCPADVLCVSGAHVKSCADVCNGK
jgi:hypothetical protein